MSENVQPVEGESGQTPTIAVAVDGTDDGKRALRYAASLAVARGQQLRLIHVAQEAVMYAPVLPYIPWETFADIGSQVLERAAAEALALGCAESQVTKVLARGPRVPALMAHLEGVTSVVLGTRHSELQHLFTGSTTTALAGHATVPILAVPATWDPEGSRSGRVVVGIEGSETATPVLDVAFGEAAARGADLEVVHAWRPTGFYDGVISARTLEQHWREEGTAKLSKLIEEASLGSPGVPWSLVMLFERTVGALHQASAHADLLVLGRRGHRTPFGLHVGSTTRTLLRTTTCPLMVVPLEDEGDVAG